MARGRVRGPRFVSAVLLALGLARASGAQPVASAPPLGDLVVPGGLARLFHAAGLEPPRDRAYALLTLSRLIYEEPIRANPEHDARAAQLRDYLDILGQWCVRVAPFPKGITLRQAETKETRPPLEDLLAFVGLGIREHGGKRLVEPHADPDAPRRRALLSEAGIEVDRLEPRLNAGETIDVVISGDTVPLPLARDTWLRTVFADRVPPEALFALLIGEREALWLYCGLLGLDEDTRTFLESHPDLLAWIHRERPALFGAFGRSVRVRGGRVETPGGAGDAPLWESLAGASTAQPVAFVRGLLQRDAGRLAWFYDSVAHLSADAQAVASARFEKDATRRFAWFRSLYSVFLTFLPSWEVGARPVIRRPLDPTLALQLISVTADGRLAGPRWMSFWQQALMTGGVPDHVPDVFKHLENDESASLPRVLGTVFGAPAQEYRARLDLALFVGRVIGDIDEARAFDALVASRGFMRFPALMLALEHIGVSDPAVYAEAARAATIVSSPAGSSQALIDRVVQLQGAVALLDRLREVHALDVPAATALVRSLFAVRPGSDGWYQGGVLGWLERQVLPALGATGELETAEAEMMMALAGVPRVPAAPRLVEWNGQRYRFDPARVALARLLRVREKQRGPDLGALLADSRRASTSSAPTATADLADRRQSSVDADTDPSGRSQPSALFGPPLSDSEPFARRLDRATAAWLASVAYAVRIEDVDAPLLLGSDPALTHDLHILDPRLIESGDAAWSLPAWTTAITDRTHVEGSLLGLALPLSRYAAPRVRAELPAHRPSVHSQDAALVLASVSAFNPLNATDDERDLIADAINRGREHVAGLLRNPVLWRAAAEKLRADEWERALIPWMLGHEPEKVAVRFPAHDLFILGGGPARGPDGWGVLARPLDGSLALRLPATPLDRVLRNQAGVGVTITQFSDLQFRVAEYLAAARLPAFLGRSLLAVAVWDFLDGAVLSHDRDWPGLVHAAAAVTDERLATYMRTLTTDGPLVREGGVPSAAHGGVECAQARGRRP